MTVATPEPMGSELAISDRQTRFSPAQRVALAHMGVGQAPDEDVDVFFHVCQRTKLDPFARQIYMIGRNERVLVNGEWRDGTKYTIQTGIDGYRTIARRIATAEDLEVEYEDMLWCGRDGVWRDVWLGEANELYAAKAVVVRGGKRFSHVALWREYAQLKRNGEPNSMWATKGANQLAKCAEAGALRKAYPQDYAGLYVDAELDHLASDAAAANVVAGGRDWWADADAAQSVEELRKVWADAHRVKQLTAELRAHIEGRVAALSAPAPVSEPPAPAAEPVVEDVEVEVVDPETGEVLDSTQEAASPAPPPIRRATITAIHRELGKVGIDWQNVDAYLPVLGVQAAHLADLTQDEGQALLDLARGLTRDRLSELMADHAQSGSGS